MDYIKLLAQGKLTKEIPLPMLLYQNLKRNFSGEELKNCIALELAFYMIEYLRVGKNETKIPHTFRPDMVKARSLFGIIRSTYDINNPITDRAGEFYWFPIKAE